jgi:hypothetical protein
MKKKNRWTAAAVTAAYIAAGIMAVFAATVIVSCASGPKAPKELLSKGTMDKKPTPEWLTTYLDGTIFDVEALFKDMYCFIGEERGPDLEFCQTFVRQYNVQAQIAEMVRTNVAAALKATRTGDAGGTDNAIDNFVNVVLNTSFSGGQRASDWWRLVRQYDPDRKEVYTDQYEAYVLYTVPRNILNQDVGTNIQTAASKDPELYQITMDFVRDIMTPGYNLRTAQSAPAPSPAPVPQAGTGKISIFSRNAPSDFISMVKIFKGTEARGEPLLTSNDPIRGDRKAEWDLPEGDYTVALYYNNSERAWGQARVSVTAGDVFNADVRVDWSSFSFKK